MDNYLLFRFIKEKGGEIEWKKDFNFVKRKIKFKIQFKAVKQNFAKMIKLIFF